MLESNLNYINDLQPQRFVLPSIKVFFAFFLFQKKEGGGDRRDRTVDPLLAKQVLSQLSYTPTSSHIKGGGPKWTRTTDLTIISRAL